MKTLTLNTLEKIINAYLSADPEIAAHLNQYAGKKIAVNLLDMGIYFTVAVEKGKIHLSELMPEHAPVVTISGRSFALLRLLINKGPVNDASIEIEGDVIFLQQLRDIFSAIDIDWDNLLAPYLGQVVARHLTNTVKKAISVAKKNSILLEKNIKLYVQEELKLFPSKEEVNDWYDQVARLRDDVERAEARIDRLS